LQVLIATIIMWYRHYSNRTLVTTFTQSW